MIDIPKLRDTAKKIRGVSWVTSKPCQFHEFMELLDKAEKWDKIKAGPGEEDRTWLALLDQTFKHADFNFTAYEKKSLLKVVPRLKKYMGIE